MSAIKPRKLIWLEDTPSAHDIEKIEIETALKGTGVELVHWGGIAEGTIPQRGQECLKHFQREVLAAKDDPECIAGFILDVRVPVDNLSVLGMDGHETSNGIITGLAIAYYYIFNNGKKSPLEDAFRQHQVLILSIAPALDKSYPWISESPLKYIQKQSEDWRKLLADWVKQVCVEEG